MKKVKVSNNYYEKCWFFGLSLKPTVHAANVWGSKTVVTLIIISLALENLPEQLRLFKHGWTIDAEPSNPNHPLFLLGIQTTTRGR
jgi:hypothetical protein